MARARQLAVTIGDKGRVTLSEEVRSHLGVAEGDVVLIELTGSGTAEIVPAALVPRDQIWFAHPEMQKRVAEGLSDIAAGRTTTLRSAADVRAHFRRIK